MAEVLSQRYRRFSVPSLFNFRTVVTVFGLFLILCMLLRDWMEKPDGITNLYLLMLIQVAPFAIAFSRQHYNYISFVLFNHFITYSLAKYNQLVNIYKSTFLFPETVTAIREQIFCTILLIIAYFLSRQLFFFRFVHKERFQFLSLTRTQLIVVASYVISVPLFVDRLPATLLALHFAAMAADMVLLLCSDSPGNERLARYLRLGVFISTFWYFVATGFLSLIGNLATYLFITGCLQRNFRTLMVPVFLAVTASAIQTVKYPYRLMLQSSPTATVFDKVGHLTELISDHYFGDLFGGDYSPDPDLKEEDDKEGLLHGFARVGDDSLERVMAWTPSRVPFWEGETYGAIPFMFIPRFMWPDKPSRHIWNKFGRLYGYLSSDDLNTSVGVGFLAEGYMNFGYLGLYCVAIFVGFFIAFVERVSYYFLGGYFYFTYVCFLMPVMQPSSDLSSMIMSIVIIVCVLFAFRTQFIKMARKDEYS